MSITRKWEGIWVDRGGKLHECIHAGVVLEKITSGGSRGGGGGKPSESLENFKRLRVK